MQYTSPGVSALSFLMGSRALYEKLPYKLIEGAWATYYQSWWPWSLSYILDTDPGKLWDNPRCTKIANMHIGKKKKCFSDCCFERTYLTEKLQNQYRTDMEEKLKHRRRNSVIAIWTAVWIDAAKSRILHLVGTALLLYFFCAQEKTSCVY